MAALLIPRGQLQRPDAFTYKVNDGTADGNTATVSITITPVNDAPVATDDKVETNENIPVAGNVLAMTRILMEIADCYIRQWPCSRNAVLNGDGTYTYTRRLL
jgi:hypothetical protein